jgi:hypothetical protein
MSVKKIIFTSLVAMSMSSISMMAYAGDLHLINNTNFDSTSIINSGMCSSSLLGNNGITKAHGTNTVADSMVKMACLKISDPKGLNCTADVYMNKNCSGKKVATVVLDVSTGVKKVTVHSSEYKITASGFNIQMDQVS